MKLSLLAILSAVGLASAHYTFPVLLVNGQKTGYYEHVRITKNHWQHGSITDVSSPDMRCGGVDKQFPVNATTRTVAAGSSVGFWAENGIGHPGPLQFYMAKAPAGQNLSKWDGAGNVWFKIAGDPPKVTDKGLEWPHAGHQEKDATVKLPASLPAGDYLLRVEQMGLHGAGESGGAQIYIQCAQVKVTGNGQGNPGPKVAFPGAYKPTDPGIKIQIYWPIPKNYVMPGPPIWKG